MAIGNAGMGRGGRQFAVVADTLEQPEQDRFQPLALLRPEQPGRSNTELFIRHRDAYL